MTDYTVKRYWYKLCSVCSEGRLMVVKQQDDSGLILLCEECESAWTSPEKAADVQKNVTITGLDISFATMEDIARAGWSRYSLNEESKGTF